MASAFILLTEDEGGTVFQNVGTYLQERTVSHPRKLQCHGTIIY
jgi:hypothetical protein